MTLECELLRNGRRGAVAAMVLAIGLVAGPAVAQDKPNILVIMGDDIGITNISAYSHGLMGYRTPHIDQLAEDGAIFTDYYGEQSCGVPPLRDCFVCWMPVLR